VPQADGTAIQSVVSALINDLPVEESTKRKEEEKIARDVAAVSYLGKDIEIFLFHHLISRFWFLAHSWRGYCE
jgi:hypothetical protein